MRAWIALAAGALGACGGSDSSGLGDSGAVDSGATDAGADVAPVDSGAPDAGHPSASIPTADIDFGMSDCGGAAPGQKTLKITNNGDGDLTFSARLDNANFFFLIGGTDATIPAGQSALITVSANAIPGGAAAATEQDGKLTITTNDPAHASTDVKVKVTASGGTLTMTPPSALFGLVPVNTQATDVPLTLTNAGNKAVKVSFTQPVDAQFSLVWTGAPAEVNLPPGAQLAGLKARFKPGVLTQSVSNAPLRTTGALCGSSPTSISMSGQGSGGVLGIQPAAIDFALVNCGASSTLTAAQRTITLTNTGNSSFTWGATLGRGAGSPYDPLALTNTTLAAGATGTIVVKQLAVPQNSPITPNLYGDTITITTNIPNDTPHLVVLTGTAQGAVLAYQPATPVAFGGIPITTTTTGNFAVVNNGNAPATVTASITGGPVFQMTNGALGALQPGDTSPLATASFTPAVAGLQNATISLAVGGTDVLCQPAPTLKTSGTGTNGQVVVTPSSLDFAEVNCGTRAAGKTVTIRNNGNGAFTYNTAFLNTQNYAVLPGSGTVAAMGQPGDTVTLTVTPIAIPAVSDVTPDLYADTLEITTAGAAGDTPHDIGLHMTARGAIFAQSVTDLQFGGVQTNSTATSQFTVTNSGNVGAAVTYTNTDAHFTFAPQGSTIAGGAGAIVVGSFRPTGVVTYSDTARLTVPNGTPLCGPIPNAINLSGSGTNGVAQITPTNLDFGLVNCGTTAQDQTISIQNTGSATFTFTATRTAGAAYYTLSAASGSVDPGNTFNLVVTPARVPSTSATTADMYAGQVTIQTSIAGDPPRIVALHETANGAILTLNVTGFAFGSVARGDSQSLPFTITNSGNATANLAYAGYTTPPFTASPDLLPILGGTVLNATMTFAPDNTTASGNLSQTYAITTSDILCAPLPNQIPVTGSVP